MRTKVLVLALVAAASLWLLSASAYAQGARADVSLTTTEAFEFNGIDESLHLGRSPVVNFGDGDFTVHVTVNFASLTNESGPCHSESGCDMSLVDKMSGFFAVNSDGWRILKQSDNRFWFCLGGVDLENGCGGDTSSTTVISQTTAEPGTWQSVTAVKSAGLIHIYVNGVLEGTTELGAFTNTDSVGILVGAQDTEGAFLNGRIGDVRLFRQALNGGQVLAQHAQTMPPS
jgi:hypothetical protein